MSRGLREKLLLLLFSLVFSFAAGEAALRVLATRDADGNTLLRGHPLRPYAPPVEHTRRLVAEYEAETDRVLEYDPDLGWAPRPGAVSRDGLYAYDAIGARTGAAAAGAASGGRPVLLFGDSFTQGDDVRYEESWAHDLERRLAEAGQGARVVNLGFAGYGMDQALLRWRKTGVPLGAAMVVFGFQAENLARNRNMLRPLLWWGSGLPFSKPRFVLEDGTLRLLNSPALRPEEVPGVLANLPSWPLARYEASYRPDDYAPRWWSRSKLASLVADRVRSREAEPSLYRLDGEPALLALAIVAELAREAEARGAAFLVVHLPKREDLGGLLAGEPLAYGDLLAELARHHRVADPTPRLLEAAAGGKLDALFAPPGLGHYSAAGNAAVGAAVAEAMIQGGVISVTSPLR